jgi:hypothetical protein
MMDTNFKKAQIFCNSRTLSDLVGKYIKHFEKLQLFLNYSRLDDKGAQVN